MQLKSEFPDFLLEKLYFDLILFHYHVMSWKGTDDDDDDDNDDDDDGCVL